jgi:hypothetical protein
MPAQKLRRNVFMKRAFFPFSALGISAVVLAVSVFSACASTPKETALAPIRLSVAPAALTNPFLGLWEGTDSKGLSYIWGFKSETEWECFIMVSGKPVPFYGGTYTYTGREAALTATKELDSKTSGWTSTALPPVSFTAELKNSGLQAPSAFTDALLKKQ